MKITILDKSKVKYGDKYLVPFQTYHDVDETTAVELIKAGEAKQASDEIAAVSVDTASIAPSTPKFDKDKNGGYVAEAKLTAEQKRDLEEKGQAKNPDTGAVVEKDETPVTGKDDTLPKDHTPEPEIKQKVYDENGRELTEEEVRAKEAAAASGAPADRLPANNAEASAAGEEVK